MMQVQKGQVKYKDRSDIVCTYGILDDGRQYYFLDGEKLGKGRIVASTALVEAIDPLVLASNIGVIDSDGNVIIPFENKAVKPISDQAMLVEISKPVTPSVIEASNMRKDPLAATRLVTTPAAIKEKVNAKMKGQGRFIFNDQFSEATVYDLDGNNLLDNKLYSFIGYSDDVLYLAGNTTDTDVITYSFKEEIPSEEVIEEVTENLDVKDLAISSSVIDEALENNSGDMLHPVELKETLVEKSDFPEDNYEAITNDVVEKDEVFDEVEEDKHDVFDDKIEVSNEVEMDSSNDFPEVKEEVAIKVPPIIEAKKVSLFKDKKLDIESKELEDEKSLDIDFKNKSFFDDMDDEMELKSSSDLDSSDNIIEDTREVMASLISLNKEQKEIISNKDAQIDTLLKFKRKAFEENRTLVENSESLRKKVKYLEKENTELNEKISKLEAEVNTLKGQVAGKGDLARLIEDAKSLLSETDNDN